MDEQQNNVPAGKRLDRVIGMLEDVAMSVAVAHVEQRRWVRTKRFALLAIAAASLGYVLAQISAPTNWHGGPSVAVIDIQGTIQQGAKASADSIVPQIRRACSESSVKGIVLRIDSPGGSPAEAERIGRALDDCRAAHPDKRVEAVTEGMAASAAYLVAVHADKIVANRFALVGSIGTIMTTLNAESALRTLGISGEQYASGPLKGAGAWFRHDTPEQAQVAQSIVNAAAHSFEEEVKERRGALLAPDAQLFSGRVWDATTAKRLGLVDRVDVYEHVLASDYRGLEPVPFAPPASLKERLGWSSLVHAVANEVLAAGPHQELR